MIFALLFGLIAYLNIFIQCRKNNGRSSITIKVNHDNNYVDSKMRELLKYLRYKEKNIKVEQHFMHIKIDIQLILKVKKDILLIL